MSRIVVYRYDDMVSAELLVIEVIEAVRRVDDNPVPDCHVAEKPDGICRKFPVCLFHMVVDMDKHPEAGEPVTRS